MNDEPSAMRLPFLLMLACGCLALGACDSKLSVDLSVADTGGLDQVNLAIESVDLLDGDSEVHALDTDLASPLDLRTLVDGATLRLIDGAKIDNGHYTGLRLHFADSGHSVRDADGTTEDLAAEYSPAFVDIDMDLGKDETAEWVATIDLRFSLQHLADGGYTLVQHLRAVDADTAASVGGSVDAETVNAAACRQGRTAGVGVAVYLYAGSTSDPVDFNSTRSGPIASAPVRASGSGYVYDLPYLAPGTYTLAWTCAADDDQRDADDTLGFTLGSTFTLGEAEAQEVDL